MGPTEPLTLGMFWGGLLVAAVPILFTLGVGGYLVWRYLGARRREASEEGP